MSINTGDNFRYQGKKYLDDRQSFKTLAELMTYTNVPPGFIAYCEENGERYEYVNDTWILYKVSTDTGDLDLSDYALKTDIPTKTSELENDSGYLKDGDIHTHENKAVLDTIDATKVNKWDNPDYNDLANKPTIPDKVSQLTNDLEFVTREYMQNHIPDLSGIDLPALVGTKFDDAVINEEETTENQTAVDFYANGVIVKTLYLPADGGGGSSNINIDDVIYYGTDEPTNDNVIWFYPNNNDYQGINIDNAIIAELMSIIQNMQSQIRQLQADVEYLKTHGGSGGGTTPDTPHTTYSYLVLEDGSKLLLEDGGGILLEQQAIIKNSSYLLLEDGSKLLLEDGGGILLEQQDIIKNSSYLLLEDGFKLLLEDGYGLLLEA